MLSVESTLPTTQVAPRNSSLDREVMSARQICDDLRRYIDLNGPTSGRDTANFHQSTGLTDVATSLQRLKEQLLLMGNRMNEFGKNFMINSGPNLLIKVLSILQQRIHEGNLTLSSSVLGRDTSRRKKAGIAEADCLQSLKILLQKTATHKTILEHVTNLETILISLTSPQLDSKCYALEVAIQILDYPGGFIAIFRALTALAGRKRDDSRLTIVTSQLKHGLATSKLNIQILVVAFLNKMVSSAVSPSHRTVVQCEADIAGFIPAALEDATSTVGSREDRETLREELGIWRRNYPNGRLAGPPYLVSSLKRRDSDFFRGRDERTDISHDSDSTMKDDQWGSRRKYEPSRSSKSTSAPLSKGVERHKRRSSRTSFADEVGSRGRDSYFTSDSDVPSSRREREISAKRSSLKKDYGGDDFRPLSRRANSESALHHHSEVISNPIYGVASRNERTRPRSSLGDSSDRLDNSQSRQRGRSSSLFHLDSVGRPRESASRERVVPVQIDTDRSNRPSSRGRKYKSFDNLTAVGNEDVIREEPQPRDRRSYQSYQSSTPREVVRESGPIEVSQDQFGGDTEDSGFGSVQRSKSDLGQKARMKGFSYLFPKKPLVEELVPHGRHERQPFEADVRIQTVSPPIVNGGEKQIYTKVSKSPERRFNSRVPIEPTPVATAPYNTTFDIDRLMSQYRPYLQPADSYRYRTTQSSTEPSSSRSSTNSTRTKSPVYDSTGNDYLRYDPNSSQRQQQLSPGGHVVYIPVRMEQQNGRGGKKSTLRTISTDSSSARDSPVDFVSNNPDPYRRQKIWPKAEEISQGQQARRLRVTQPGGQQKLSSRPQPAGVSQADVDDAMRNFDYLNDYGVDDSSHYASAGGRF